MEPKTLLDTDVLSGLMRQTPAVVDRARDYPADHSRLSISLITRFEILRGLKASGATTRLAAFDAFCAANEVLPVDESVVARAAEIYAMAPTESARGRATAEGLPRFAPDARDASTAALGRWDISNSAGLDAADRVDRDAAGAVSSQPVVSGRARIARLLSRRPSGRGRPVAVNGCRRKTARGPHGAA
jgi:predicted nucleic acid-binding protein